ncbi:MAG: 4Fe-4S binding protein [Bacillota bacterium]
MGAVHERLVEKLELAGSKRALAIVEHILNDEEATIADNLPGSPEEVAEKTGMAVERVRDVIDELFRKGFAFIRGDMSKKASYRFVRGGQFHDATLASQHLDPVKDHKYFELWQDFAINEMYPKQAQNVAAGLFLYGRVIPAYNAIKDLPDVQPWENFREILKQQTSIGTVPCSCRWRTKGAGHICSHTNEAEYWQCLQFGKSADYVEMRGSGKKLTLEEAIAYCDKAEDDGLVRLWAIDRRMFFYSVCQCCPDCCANFVSTREHGVDIEKMIAKSRYLAEVNQNDCSGCQTCIDRCSFNAIDMVKQGKKYKAVVDEEKCFGCGVCVLKCDTGALKMKTARSIDYVPEQVQGQHG